MSTEARITTREAADDFGIRIDEARVLLRAAGIPHDRLGRAFLWHREAVVEFFRALRAREGSQ